MLKEATVAANVAQVQVSGDSVVYNAAAYRTPEGSALQDLVKKLPGAKVDDEGNITINGKTVKKILVDGKEFFFDDTKMAMQNIPTSLIDKLKTYERKSDFSRVTGIDDGEEETVLDLTVKKGMNNGWFGNINAGYGTEDRYSVNANINRFIDQNQFSVMGGGNNTGVRGFGGGGGRGWGLASTSPQHQRNLRWAATYDTAITAVMYGTDLPHRASSPHAVHSPTAKAPAATPATTGMQTFVSSGNLTR